MTARAAPASLWLRALLYMLLVGGGWLVVLPLGILWLENGDFAIQWRGAPFFVAGGVLGLCGAAVALAAGYQLIEHGRGTPFPLDPTRRLVTSGPYAHVRNPQSMAMMLMTAGVVAAVESHWLWVMLALTLVYLEVLVGPWEERDLRKRHGAEYASYCRTVRKWLPRTEPYRAREEG